MSYTAAVEFSLGFDAVGLTDLRVRLYSATSTVGGLISTGFREMGYGQYIWSGTVDESVRIAFVYSLSDPSVSDSKPTKSIATLDGGNSGNGDVLVNHNYGQTDRWRWKIGNAYQDNVIVSAYVQADFDAMAIDPRPPYAISGSDGRWINPLMLDPNTYLFVVNNPNTKVATIIRDVVVT